MQRWIVRRWESIRIGEENLQACFCETTESDAGLDLDGKPLAFVFQTGLSGGFFSSTSWLTDSLGHISREGRRRACEIQIEGKELGAQATLSEPKFRTECSLFSREKARIQKKEGFFTNPS